MGRLITIPNFDQGINSQDDPEDTRQLLICQNFETDQRGQIYKRNAKHYITAFADKAVDAIIKWVQENLNNGAEWIIFFRNSDTNKDEIARYIDTFGTSVAITDFGVDSKDGDICQIIPFTNVVRFANGRTRNPGIFQYIDRQFLFGEWQPSAGWNYDDARPSFPTTWTESFIDSLLGTQGSLSAGTYYYKFVPVFDGNQEDVLPTTKVSGTAGANDALLLRVAIDINDFNKRITAINVYRSSDFISYYHIKTVPLNTKSTDDDLLTLASANSGYCMWDPGGNFAGASAGEYLRVNGADFTIDSVESDHIVTVGLITAANDGWGDSWEIRDAEGGGGSQTASGSNGHWGQLVVFKSTLSLDIDQYNNWIVSKDPAPNNRVAVISDTKAKAVLMAGVPGTDVGSSGFESPDIDLVITNGYYFRSPESGVYHINIVDYGISEGAQHDLSGVDNIDVNYKYGVYMNGRMFPMNVRVDSEDTEEDHSDWIMYTPLNQPDIIPIDNYIQVKDMQGGEIIGGVELGGDLAVLLERGVFRLDVPTDNPANWSLVESNENIGCIAPHSIIKANGVLFFAGKSNVYALTGNYRDYPIADDIKDEYQAKASLEDSEFEYDHLKGRLLCRFGTDVETIYCFDVQKWLETGEKKWSTIECATSFKTDRFAIDEDSVVYTIYGERIHDLYDTDGSNETFAGQWKTGHIPVGVMGERGILREISISYLSAEAITVKIYIDKASAVAKTITLPANTSSGSRFVNRRLGLRANFFQVELLTPTSNTNNSTIEKLEILADE